MSYAISAALQSAVFLAVSGDAGVQSLVGSSVYDATPAGVLPLTYVIVGDEDVRPRSDGSGAGAAHDFIVSIFSDAAGYSGAKNVAVAVSDVLEDADFPLSRGALVSLRFLRGKARRVTSPSSRRIDLWFRARVEDV